MRDTVEGILMDDIFTQADRALKEICAERNVTPSDEVRTGFRLGFVAGTLKHTDAMIEQMNTQEHPAG